MPIKTFQSEARIVTLRETKHVEFFAPPNIVFFFFLRYTVSHESNEIYARENKQQRDDRGKRTGVLTYSNTIIPGMRMRIIEALPYYSKKFRSPIDISAGRGGRATHG